MKQRSLRRLALLSFPFAAMIACGADSSGGVDTPDGSCNDGCDAGAVKSDASHDATSSTDANASDVTTSDVHVDANDADDASTSDGSSGDASDASTNDGDADAATTSDANVYPADGGAPTGPALLVTDTTANKIFLVTTSGVVLHTYASPVANVTGVSFDRRARNGFWVVGRDAGHVFYKTAWSGASMGSVAGKSFTGSSVRGLDHWVPKDAGPDADLLTVIATNSTSIDALSGFNSGDGNAAFQMGFFAGSGFDGGFWGVTMLNFSESANEMLAWVSHDIANDAVERWRTASIQASVPISITQPRGMARAESGELWVVDGANKTIVHLDSGGSVLGSFAAPGTNPAGLSYDPGP